MQDLPVAPFRRNFVSGKINRLLSFELRIGTYNLSTNSILPSSHFFFREPHTRSNEKTLLAYPHCPSEMPKALKFVKHSVWIKYMKSHQNLWEKNKRKEKKNGQWYDTKTLADYSLSLSKTYRPFLFLIWITLEVEASISSQSQLKLIEIKKN